MKRPALNLFIITAIISPFRKTSKSRIINDWKIISYEETYTSIDEKGDTYTEKTFLDETNYGLVTEGTGISSGTNETGTVSRNEYMISKDGTWLSASEVIYTAFPGTIAEQSVKKASGTWHFVNKIRGIGSRKTRCIILNILAESENITPVDGPAGLNHFSAVYLPGEKSVTYLIRESSGKELQLESVRSEYQTTNGGAHANVRLIRILMEQK